MRKLNAIASIGCTVLSLAFLAGTSNSLQAQAPESREHDRTHDFDHDHEHGENAVLKVSSSPSGAHVSIDGVDTRKLTPMSTELRVGMHRVSVFVPNSAWNPDFRTVDVVPGNNDLSVNLPSKVTV